MKTKTNRKKKNAGTPATPTLPARVNPFRADTIAGTFFTRIAEAETRGEGCTMAELSEGTRTLDASAIVGDLRRKGFPVSIDRATKRYYFRDSPLYLALSATPAPAPATA